MLDAFGYAVLIVMLPAIIAAIVLALPLSLRHRCWLAAGLAAWFGWTAVAPRTGALFGILLPVIAGTVLLLANTSARAVLLRAILPGLIGVHVSRLAGGFFLLLHDAGRLSNPFAVIAGWGDILSAVLAVPAAIIAMRARPGWQPWVLAWNSIGFVDFLTAVALGATSQPGSPIQIFTATPGATLLGDLPWRFIPAFYVPLFLIIHIAIFIRLWLRRGHIALP